MNLLTRARAAIAALAILQLAACGGGRDSSPPEAPPPPPPVTQRATTFGPVAGTDDSATTGTYSWKGVPYAKAPVGALRWMPPVDPEPWTAPRDAKSFASACVQSGRLYGPGQNNRYDETIGTSLGKTVGSEDCLYLNIWAPATPSDTPRPVIVWVHGGSNITGYTADPVYDGANLARVADAVVVSVNYRLGVFGFLNVAQLHTGDPLVDSGNFAMLDQIQALKFVQRNIAAFGGDPGNVTLMGQSAGAVNVLALFTSPVVTQANPKLFHRLIPISGGISTPATLPPNSFYVVADITFFADQGKKLLQQSLIADGTEADVTAADAWIAGHTQAEVSAYLRGKAPDDLLKIVRGPLTAAGYQNSNPLPDGNVLPVDPIAAIRAGRYLKVPVLAGNTRDEGKLFPSLLVPSARAIPDATVFDIAYHYNPNGAATTTVQDWIPALYLPVADPFKYNYWTEYLNGIWFIVLRNDLLDSVKTQQTEVWHYQFDWDEEPAPFNDIFGAAHAFDLPFVFGNFGPSLYSNISFSQANAPGRLALSAAMMKTVGAFARTGDPNNDALPARWDPWPAKMLFDAGPDATHIQPQ